MRFLRSLTVAAACAVSAPLALARGGVEVVETSSEAWATESGAQYERVVSVMSDGGLTVDAVVQALMRNNATGARGFCPTCTSTTPESRQHVSPDLIVAEGVVPGNLPSPVSGTARIRRERNRLYLSMRTSLNSLDAQIAVWAESETEIRVREAGVTAGPFATRFAQGHLDYFELRSAVARELEARLSLRAARPACGEYFQKGYGETEEAAYDKARGNAEWACSYMGCLGGFEEESHGCEHEGDGPRAWLCRVDGRCVR